MAERKIYCQGSIPEYANDGDNLDRLYLPTRALSFGFGDRDGLFILPDHTDVITYHQQLDGICRDLSLSDFTGRTIFVPDSNYLLDVSILENITLLEKQLVSGHSYAAYPYATTEYLEAWVNQLREKGFAVSVDLPRKNYYTELSHPSNRSGWGRSIHQPENLSFPEKSGIPYPLSFVGQGLAEIVLAYQMLVAFSKNSNAYFKPVFSSGGFTLKRISSEEELVSHYQNLEQQGALNILNQETPVEIQQEIPEIRGFGSIQYQDNQIVSPKGLTVQLVDHDRWQGNVFNNGADPRFVHQAAEIFEKFRSGLRTYFGEELKGTGGIDFAVVESQEEQKLVMIEHNGRRITGAHPVIALAQGLGIETPYMSQKSPGNPNCDLATLWNLLKKCGLQYDPRVKSGIMPVVWMPGSGMLFGAAESATKAQEIIGQAYNELEKNNYIIR